MEKNKNFFNDDFEIGKNLPKKVKKYKGFLGILESMKDMIWLKKLVIITIIATIALIPNMIHQDVVFADTGFNSSYIEESGYTVKNVVEDADDDNSIKKNDKIEDEDIKVADSGFGTSYDSGGSSSSSDSYSSDYGSDYDGGYEGDGVVGLISIGIWIIIFVVSIALNRGSTNNSTNTVDSKKDEETEKKILQYIPNFNKKAFLEQGYKIYLDVQDAWMNFKLDDVKNVITDELYNMYESQLSTLEVKGQQNIMKDFKLLASGLENASVQNNNLTVTAIYKVSFYDYIIEQSSNKVLRGSTTNKVTITYKLKFRASLDDTKKIDHCPNCGAKLDVNSNGNCEYCGSKIVNENNCNWVLTEKQNINQQ